MSERYSTSVTVGEAKFLVTLFRKQFQDKSVAHKKEFASLYRKVLAITDKAEKQNAG